MVREHEQSLAVVEEAAPHTPILSELLECRWIFGGEASTEQHDSPR